jgi:hypothetical protein
VIGDRLWLFHNHNSAVDFVIRLTEWGPMRMDLEPALPDIGGSELEIFNTSFKE